MSKHGETFEDPYKGLSDKVLDLLGKKTRWTANHWSGR